jgi:hypothetical protein
LSTDVDRFCADIGWPDMSVATLGRRGWPG